MRDRQREPHLPSATADSADVDEMLRTIDLLLADIDARYDRRPLAATILLTDFFMDYLRALYRAFDGDVALALVLGEIGQATTRRYTEAGRHDALDLAQAASSEMMEVARPCNALSASLASGVPRETARRKVRELARRGWIEERDGGWVTTVAAGERFVPTFNREQTRRLLATARRLLDALARE